MSEDERQEYIAEQDSIKVIREKEYEIAAAKRDSIAAWKAANPKINTDWKPFETGVAITGVYYVGLGGSVLVHYCDGWVQLDLDKQLRLNPYLMVDPRSWYIKVKFDSDYAGTVRAHLTDEGRFSLGDGGSLSLSQYLRYAHSGKYLYVAFEFPTIDRATTKVFSLTGTGKFYNRHCVK